MTRHLNLARIDLCTSTSCYKYKSDSISHSLSRQKQSRDSVVQCPSLGQLARLGIDVQEPIMVCLKLLKPFSSHGAEPISAFFAGHPFSPGMAFLMARLQREAESLHPRIACANVCRSTIINK